VFDPKSRITAAESLNHPYFTEYQEELLVDQMQTNATISPFDWSFTEKDLSAREWREKVVELSELFNQANPREALEGE
jgi:hypothetical protein